MKKNKIQFYTNEKKIKHIISRLYKIKSIDRKKEYTAKELRKIIFNHKIGKEVIQELRKEKVTEDWFLYHNQPLLADIFKL